MLETFGLFEEFPLQIFKWRKLVQNIFELEDWIQRKNGEEQFQTTIYGFRHTKKDERYREWPLYDSANVNKIFFDIDDFGERGFEVLQVCHKYLMEQNIKHVALASGGHNDEVATNFHLYVFCKEPLFKRDALKNYSAYFNKEISCWVNAELRIDQAQIFDPTGFTLDTMARYPDTLNMSSMEARRVCQDCNKLEKEAFIIECNECGGKITKKRAFKHRNKYCIFLTEDELKSSDPIDMAHEIFKLADHKRNLEIGVICGSELLNFAGFDYHRVETEIAREIRRDVKYNKDISAILSILPVCIRNLIFDKDLNYSDFYLLLVALKHHHFVQEQINHLLYNCLQSEIIRQGHWSRNAWMIESVSKINLKHYKWYYNCFKMKNYTNCSCQNCNRGHPVYLKPKLFGRIIK